MKILTKFFSNKYYRDQFVSDSLYFSSLTEYTKIKSKRKIQQLADAGNIEAKAELDKLKNNELGSTLNLRVEYNGLIC